MTQKEQEIAETETWYSQDKKHRYLFKKTWSKGGEHILLLTINPASYEPYVQDLTTLLIEMNVRKLGVTGFCVINLFSRISKGTAGRSSKWGITEKMNDLFKTIVSDKQIKKMVVAVGSITETNQTARKQLENFYGLLTAKQKKNIEVLVDVNGKSAHPLAPKMRNEWYFKSYETIFLDKGKVNVQEKHIEKRNDG